MSGDAEELDVFMLGVLMRQHHEETHERRPDYMFALDWVLDAWRAMDDPARKKLTLYAAACSDALEEMEPAAVVDVEAGEQ